MAINMLRLASLLVVLAYRTESSAFPKLSLQTFTLEELVPLQPMYYPDRLSVQWISDTEYIFRDPLLGIRKYNAESDTALTFLDDADLYMINNYSLTSYSKDGKYILLSTNRKKVYRYSSVADYSIFDMENKAVKELGEQLQVVVWGSHRELAYVQNNNVFFVPDVQDDQVLQLTTQGVPGRVYCGVADWIYEEEVLNAAEALSFSTNSTFLAVATFNDTGVQSAVFPYYGEAGDTDSQYPRIVEFKYPKAGRKNPSVALRVFKLTEMSKEPWLIPAPVDIIGKDYILGRFNWATDQNLMVLWLNRRQNKSVLVNCDLQDDRCNILDQQLEPHGWIDIQQPIFDKSGSSLVEVKALFDGYQRYLHAGRLDFAAFTIEDLSPGNSTVMDVDGWNQESDTVYYTVAPSSSPWQRQLWATCAGVVRCVSCRLPGCHSASTSFSPESGFALVTCSATNVPPKIYLYNSKTDSFKLMKDNSRLALKLSHYRLPMVLFNIINLNDKLKAHVKLLLPPEIGDKKYPLIVSVYAGPGTTRVKDGFDLDYYNMYLAANRSFVVAFIDVRGTKAMGVENMHAVNEALGTVEITDTLAAVRKLVELYSFIDESRVGVSGWSYGGFVSTMMLIQDRERMISCAAAIAPVTSWLYYDSIYTERYMGLPSTNKLGYARSDVTSLAERLRGRSLLLVHGTGDDNVHYQNSLLLAKQLQRADIPFQQMSYTDESHSLAGVSRHLYHTLDRYWTDCFK